MDRLISICWSVWDWQFSGDEGFDLPSLGGMYRGAGFSRRVLCAERAEIQLGCLQVLLLQWCRDCTMWVVLCGLYSVTLTKIRIVRV